MMRIAWTLPALLVTACLDGTLEVEPGDPLLLMPSSWIQGERVGVKLAWPNRYRCGMDAWGCREPTTTMTVLDVACSGCTIVDDPTGKTSAGRLELGAIATADDRIVIDVEMRFDATGARHRLSRPATVDREVALEAECKLISTSELDAGSMDEQFIARSQFRDCDSTRRASETVVIFPAIRTSRGEIRFPFCPDRPCEGPEGESFRQRSAISFSATPIGWGFSNVVLPPDFTHLPPYFAVMPELGSTQVVSASVALVSGEISTSSVAVPPVE